jgi:serine/threonine protein kinase
MSKETVLKNAKQAVESLLQSDPRSWFDLNQSVSENVDNFMEAFESLQETFRARAAVLKEIEARGKKKDKQSVLADKEYQYLTKFNERLLWLDNKIWGMEQDNLNEEGTWDPERVNNLREAYYELAEETNVEFQTEYETDDQWLEAVENYEKVFDNRIKELKEDYYAFFSQIKPSDIVRARPIHPYQAKLPDTLDPVQLTKGISLGKGAFGEAFLLVNSGPAGPRTLAMKVLNPGDTPEEQEEKRTELRKEVMLYERIGDHPNIMKCYGIKKVGEQEGMVMEALEGGNAFKNLLKLNEKLEAGEISETEYTGFLQHTMRGLMQGLAHMEKAGIAHLDVKFPNLMMGKDGEIKIIDPGISEEIGLAADTIPDNPLYKDPVLARDVVAMPYNDVFSAGQSLYEMMKSDLLKVKKKDGSVVDEFLYGLDSSKFMSRVERAGESWLKEASSRVFKIMPKEAKKELKEKIEAAQNSLKIQLEEFEKTWEASKGYFTSHGKSRGKARSQEEMQAAYASQRKDFFDEYEEQIKEIRAKYIADYGSPLESAYLNFMNQIMHPDPSQRLSAAAALDHPFLADSMVQDEEKIKEIFWKLKPELHPDKRTPAEPGEPITMEAPIEAPLDIPVEEQNELKKLAQFALDDPEDMSRHMADQFQNIMATYHQDMKNWKGRANAYQEDKAIMNVIDKISEMPDARFLITDMVSTPDKAIQEAMNVLDSQLRHCQGGLSHYRELPGELDEQETASRDLLEEVKVLLVKSMKHCKKLLFLDASWRQAFGKGPGGSPRSYATNEESQRKLEGKVKTRLVNSLNDILQKGKENNPKNRRKAMGSAFETLRKEEDEYIADQLEQSQDPVSAHKKSSLLKPILHDQPWKKWASWAAKELDRLKLLLKTCDEQVEALGSKGERSPKEQTCLAFYQNLQQKLCEDLIPRKQAENIMLSNMQEKYEDIFSSI